jgi:hypothetical protein
LGRLLKEKGLDQAEAAALLREAEEIFNSIDLPHLVELCRKIAEP